MEVKGIHSGFDLGGRYHQKSPEDQNKGTQGPAKLTHILQTLKKNTNNKENPKPFITYLDAHAGEIHSA